MKKIIAVVIIGILLIYGIGAFLEKDNNFIDKPIATTVKEAYPARKIKNIEVKNYNIIGEKTNYYDHVPQRVVAVGENINETLVALGVEDKVICAIKYGNPYYVPEDEYAEEYNRIKFESGIILNTETVLAMYPDLIISGQSLFTNKRLKSTDFWNNREIHTFLPPNANSPSSHNYRESLELEYEFILGLGAIFNKEEQARNFVFAMQQDIESIKNKMQGRSKQKVIIVEGLGKHLVAYDESKLAGDICTKLGAYVPPAPLGVIGIEYLLEENPDIIFVVKSGGDPELAADIFRNIPALQSLQAIKNNRVHGISLNYTYNSAIKTKSSIKKFSQALYPELNI